MAGNKSRIAIIATLDTKGEEALYLKESVERKGFTSLVIDTGILGEPLFCPQISREDVAIRGGMKLTELISLKDKGFAIAVMARGARKLLAELYQESILGGVIAMGGGQGTFIGTFAMRGLPLGFPKIMVSTIVSGNMRPFVGTEDIILFNSVVDLMGLNSISKAILDNAINALIGMVRKPAKIVRDSSFKVGVTTLGTTTPGLIKAKKILLSKGYEFIPFHANGSGGKAMENLLKIGFLDGVIDWSIHEVVDEVCVGIFAGDNRLGVLEKVAVPYLLVPGGIDYIVMGSLGSLREEQKRRSYIVHNENITLVRTTNHEMEKVALFLVEKINKAKGNLALVIPLRGFSAHDAPGEVFYQPEVDKVFVEVLKENINPDVPIIEIDANINDLHFVQETIKIFEGLLTESKKERN